MLHISNVIFFYKFYDSVKCTGDKQYFKLGNNPTREEYCLCIRLVVYALTTS